MDALTYAAVCDLSRRIAGRMSDDTLGVVRGFYAAGEWDLGDDTLLLNLAYEGVGITAEERQLIRSFLGDPNNTDLDDVRTIDAPPPVRHQFSADGPRTAPDPTKADEVLSTHAPAHGGTVLRRVWRNDEVWLYILHIDEGADTLSAHSGLTSRLWVELNDRSPLEVVDGRLSPYQAAAVAVARQIWHA